jgi:dTDP-4-amino-4,6-dideoxygalactose transaminase
MYEGRPVYENAAVRSRPGADAARDRCPQTEDLAARSVTVGIGPAFTVEDCEQVAAGVQKVARHGPRAS